MKNKNQGWNVQAGQLLIKEAEDCVKAEGSKPFYLWVSFPNTFDPLKIVGSVYKMLKFNNA